MKKLQGPSKPTRGLTKSVTQPDEEGLRETRDVLADAKQLGLTGRAIGVIIGRSEQTVSGYGKPGKDGTLVAMPRNHRKVLRARLEEIETEREAVQVAGPMSDAELLILNFQRAQHEQFRKQLRALTHAIEEIHGPSNAPPTASHPAPPGDDTVV